jgi:hypothetical protein
VAGERRDLLVAKSVLDIRISRTMTLSGRPAFIILTMSRQPAPESRATPRIVARVAAPGLHHLFSIEADMRINSTANGHFRWATITSRWSGPGCLCSA